MGENQHPNHFKHPIGKLRFLGVLFTAILIALMVRIVYIREAHGDNYGRWATDQYANRQSSQTTLTAIRGNIFDRNKQSLALSYAVDNIILDIGELMRISKIEDKDRSAKKVTDTIANLSQHLGIPPTDIQKLLVEENAKKRYHVLASEVDREITTKLMASDVICVYTEANSMRTYPHSDLMPQVIGFIRNGGNWGLEQSYNKELSGVNGSMFQMQDEQGALTSKEESIDGYSLVTTIDTVIQQYAEDAIRHSNERFESEVTAAVVMNPKTGEVLAMAQYPPFNLNDPLNIDEIGGISDTTGLRDLRFKIELDALSEADQVTGLSQFWANFNVSSSFEPGSIYKPVVVAAALEENIIDINSGYYCGGSDPVTKLNCHLKTGHGSQTLTQVLANSCNVGMMDIARSMGKERFHKYHADFGFGEKTGIDLPAEASLARWQYSLAQLGHPLNLGTSSFGQGFTATSIQSLNAFSAVINGGNLMKPYVVSQVLDTNGNIVKENYPTIERKVISEETSRFMRQAMVSTLEPEGTGRRAAIKGYAIGGKTGTAQQGIRHEDSKDDDYSLSFVSYFPAEDPEVTVLVVMHKVTNYTTGVQSPAPLILELMESIIKYRGYLPTGDDAEAVAIRVQKGSVALKDLVGHDTTAATQYLNNLQLNFTMIGNGNVVDSQMPSAGAMVAKGDTIHLRLKIDESVGDEASLVLVPDVQGIPASQAFTVIKDIGLTPVVFSAQRNLETATTIPTEGETAVETGEPENLDISGELILDQMPGANTKVQAGTEVTLKVQ